MGQSLPQFERDKSLESKLLFKRFYDVALTVILLAVFLPIIFLICILIKLDDWIFRSENLPIFYAEPRISKGKTIGLLKFRTVSKKGMNWILENPDERSMTGCSHPTFIGKILLKWYLDELPQLFNIIKGDMVLVGPRPQSPGVYREFLKAGVPPIGTLTGGLLGMNSAAKRLWYRKKEAKRYPNLDINKPWGLEEVYRAELKRRSAVGIFLLDFVQLFEGALTLLTGPWNHDS